jgi:methyl-accepting chemotaxis protein
MFNRHLTWFYNLKTTTKLIAILGLLALTGAISGILGYFQISALNDRIQMVFANNVRGMNEISITSADLTNLNYIASTIVSQGVNNGSGIITTDRMKTHVAVLKKMYPDDTDTIEEQMDRVIRGFNDALKNPQIYHDTAKGRQLLLTIQQLGNELNLLRDLAQEIGVANLEDTLNATSKTSRMMGIFTVLILIVSGLLGFITIRSIVQPLFRLKNAMVNLADGDLILPKMPAVYKDEIGETTKAYQESVTQLRGMIVGIREATGTLTQKVEELVPQVSAAGDAAVSVSRTMNELARGTQEQAKAADEVAGVVREVVQKITKVNQDTQVIADYSTTVIAEASQGQEDTKTIMVHINNVVDASEEAGTVIGNLLQHSEEISNIISKIREMTEQTQLLSLNASIEAARAGEYGRGFAVVAQEVGKLATRSGQSVQEIEAVLNNVQNLIAKAVQVMEVGVGRANEGRQVIAGTSERFNQIFGSINKVADQIREVAKETQSLNQANQKVMEAIDTIAAISEQTAASSQEVVATVENQSTNVAQIADGMDGLNAYFNELGEAVAKFKV